MIPSLTVDLISKQVTAIRYNANSIVKVAIVKVDEKSKLFKNRYKSKSQITLSRLL